METLRGMVQAYQEHYRPSLDLAENQHFIRLGLTDAGILELVSKDNPLLTTDVDLYLAALGNGERAFNFNHLRLEHLLKE